MSSLWQLNRIFANQFQVPEINHRFTLLQLGVYIKAILGEQLLSHVLYLIRNKLLLIVALHIQGESVSVPRRLFRERKRYQYDIRRNTLRSNIKFKNNKTTINKALNYF